MLCSCYIITKFCLFNGRNIGVLMGMTGHIGINLSQKL